jgi:multidrug resistance efflux pump
MRTLRWIVRFFPVCVGLLLLSAVVFAVFARIERVVEAGGEVRVQSYELVRPRVSGLVQAVRVEPGEEVRSGQVLAQLQDHELQRELLTVRQEFQAAHSRLDRLFTERRLHVSELQPLEINHRRFALSRNSLDVALSVSKAAEFEIELEMKRQRRQQAWELAKAGVISQQELQKAQQEELAADQRRSQSRLQERMMRLERSSLDQEMLLRDAQQRRTLAELDGQIRELEAQAEQWAIRVDELERLKAFLEVRANMNGVVTGLPSRDLLGQHVQAGKEIFSIIDISSVSFVTRVTEQTIVQVRPGQSAYVEIAGLPKSRFQVFAGRVLRVDQSPMVDAQGGVPLYPVHVQLSEPWIELDEGRFYLRNGMRGTAKIAYRHNVPLIRAVYEFLVGKPEIPEIDGNHRRASRDNGRPDQPKSPAWARLRM